MGKLPTAVPAGLQSIPHQMNMTFDTVELQGMSAVQRTNAIRNLATLLMQAAGIATAKEHDDDKH
jgi:hypothetical protein